MPPFRLELPDRPEKVKRFALNLYSKGIYKPGVKVSNWNDPLCGLPFDRDPYDSEDRDLQLSHYNHFGNEKLNYLSESKEKYQYTPKTDNLDPHKRILNVISYRDEAECVLKKSICPTLCVNDYRTTMQQSYYPPYPYAMPRLSLPKTPYFENRHIVENIEFSPYKFYDEDVPVRNCRLQKYKMHKHVSFNPMTGKYTNET